MNEKLKSNTYAFVINSYGREAETVQKSLESIKLQIDHNASIFLFDQNSEPLLVNTNKVNQIKAPFKSISRARNLALNLLGAEWIIFVDDDAILAPNYYQELKLITSSTMSPDLIAGTIKCSEDPERYYSKRQISAGKITNFLQTKKVMGGNIVIKFDQFKELNGFDENFGIGSKWQSGEDSDIAWNLYFKNKNILLSNKLIILHPSPRSISNEKAYLYGIGKGALVKKWLRKNKRIVILEVIEMLVVPIIKFLLTFKFSYNYHTFKGRIKGLLSR